MIETNEIEITTLHLFLPQKYVQSSWSSVYYLVNLADPFHYLITALYSVAESPKSELKLIYAQADHNSHATTCIPISTWLHAHVTS